MGERFFKNRFVGYAGVLQLPSSLSTCHGAPEIAELAAQLEQLNPAINPTSGAVAGEG